ncbi:TPA: ECF transporter S component [Streptococcus pneumoniae]
MTNTRRLSTIAILSAISFVLMYFDFPLLPAASFLKIEFSILPVLVGLVVMDLPAALGVLLLRSLLKLLLNSQGVNTYIGLPMNIVALGVFVIVFALIWKKERTTLRFLLGSLAGTVGLTLAMLVLNYVYAVPLYAKFANFANFDIGKILGLSNYLMTMVLPFNLIEGVIFSVSFWLLYVLLKPTLKHYER